MGPAPLEWADIEAFCRRSGSDLRPWEVEVIEAIDDRWLADVSETKPAEAEPPTPPARPMSPELFDAIFG
jgi:hypothetical protein